MNPSYFRINLTEKEAMDRLCKWMDKQPKEIIPTNISHAVDVACDNGHWKGSSLYVYEQDGWTTFDDLSGFFSFLPVEQWLAFAGTDNLVVAGYNDAIPYGELIVIENEQVLRNFVDLPDDPEENQNEGELPFESEEPIESWIDIESFIDGDDYYFSDNGTVIIF